MDKKFIQEAVAYYKSHHTETVDMGEYGTLPIESSSDFFQELYVTHNVNINKVIIMNYLCVRGRSIDMSAELSVNKIDELIKMLEFHKQKLKSK